MQRTAYAKERNTMKKNKKSKIWKSCSIIFLGIIVLWTSPSGAMQLKLDFEEIAQNSDLIYIGTVEKQNCRLNEKGLIVTDVYFTNIEIVHATDLSQQKQKNELRLTYVGGEIDEKGLMVSDMPTFQNNHHYVLFIWDDGKTYLNPLVGGNQGLFEVLEDTITQKQFVTTADRKAITGISREGIQTCQNQVVRIQNGEMIVEKSSEDVSESFLAPPAVPDDPADAVSGADIKGEKGDENVSPLELEEFLQYLVDNALKTPLKESKIRRGGQGKFYRNQDGKINAEPIQTTYSPKLPDFENINAEIDDMAAEPIASATEDAFFYGESEIEDATEKGGAMGACGYHNLLLTMEQVPTSWWSYSVNAGCMNMWDRFMNIYTYKADDGSFGNNNQNEFCGWVNSTDLANLYSSSWGTGIAMCFTEYTPPCGKIVESDVMWNPAYSWTDDAIYAIGNSGVILLAPVAMHELGHTWGYQIGSYAETYDYDVPSVMHSYYSNIVENGNGIHSSDADLVRRHYDDQTSVINITDVGVESYYASGGLRNSATNKSTYYPGDSITLSNVTVENMSNYAISNLRLRFFLSTNRIISTSDYQIGGYWYWASFCKECRNVGTYTTTIPSNIPAGTYYIGAMVTVNGYNNDGYTQNSTTSFYRSIKVATQ
jgi:hypothetical protein